MDAAAVGAWATVVLAVGTSVSVIVLAQQMRSERRAAERSAREAARISALRFYADTISTRLETWGGLPPDRARDRVLAVVDKAVPAPGKVGDLALCEVIHRYLSYWELLGVGVRTDTLDGEFLHDMVGGRVGHIARNYESFIARERVRLDAPALYEALVWLAARWQRRDDLATPAKHPDAS